jgi:hypothetical protein
MDALNAVREMLVGALAGIRARLGDNLTDLLHVADRVVLRGGPLYLLGYC